MTKTTSGWTDQGKAALRHLANARSFIAGARVKQYARTVNPDSDLYLTDEVKILVANQMWQSNQTGGFAEAFLTRLCSIGRSSFFPFYSPSIPISVSFKVLVGSVVDNIVTQNPERAIRSIEKYIMGTEGDAPSESRAALIARTDPRLDAECNLI